MKKTFSKKNVRGTQLNVLIIGEKYYEKNLYNDIEEILKEFDILYDIVLAKEEMKEKIKNKHYDIIFIEDDFMKDNEEKQDVLELINIVKENNKENSSLIIGLMHEEDKVFRKILNDNDIELILFKPVNKGQIIVILRNDFKWEVALE